MFTDTGHQLYRLQGSGFCDKSNSKSHTNTQPYTVTHHTIIPQSSYRKDTHTVRRGNVALLSISVQLSSRREALASAATRG